MFGVMHKHSLQFVLRVKELSDWSLSLLKLHNLRLFLDAIHQISLKLSWIGSAILALSDESVAMNVEHSIVHSPRSEVRIILISGGHHVKAEIVDSVDNIPVLIFRNILDKFVDCTSLSSPKLLAANLVVLDQTGSRIA